MLRMWHWLSRPGADHPRGNIFFGVAFAGIGGSLLLREPLDWGPVAMIALGALCVLMGVLGLFARRA